MGFLNPWMLFGTLGVSVPIIIHLLNRYRHRQVEWGAMELLRQAIVVRSRQVQIEDLILLVLRCLAVLLIALAIARPTISTTFLGKNSQAGVVIAIDGSYSMEHRSGVNSRFESALAKTREILQTVSPGDPISIVLMGNQPRILLRNVGYDKDRVEDILKDLRPVAQELKLELNFTDPQKGVRALVTEMKAAARECYIVTDAQQITWGHPSDIVRQAMADIAALGKLYVLSAGSDNGENLGLTRFEIGGGAIRKGAIARFDADVRNFGKFPQKSIAVDLLAGDTRVDRRVIDDLNPGESKTVPLYIRFDKAGAYRLKAHLGMDPLEADNDRYAAVTVRDQIKVLLIDGRPSNQPYQSATAYLQTALAPQHGTTSRDSILTKTVSWLEVGSQKLTDFDVILMADVPNIRPDDVKNLYGYIEHGGGLIVFLGKNVSAEVMNQRMLYTPPSGKPVPLLPAELKDIADAGESAPGSPIESAMDHPLSRWVGHLSKGLMDEARVRAYFRLKLNSDGRAILKIAADGSPLLAEKTIGLGKVLLFASSADRQWSNFMAPHPAGPILLYEAVTYLTTPPLDRELTVGVKLTIPLPDQLAQTSVVVREPDLSGGLGRKESPVQVTEVDGRKMADFGVTERAGFYEVQAGGATLVAAANVSPAEGEVRSLETTAFSTPLEGTNARVLGDGVNIATTVRDARVGRELWRWLMGLGMLALVVELALARYFSHRMARVESQAPRDRSEQLLSETRNGNSVASAP